MDSVKSSAIRGLDFEPASGTVTVHFVSGGSHHFGPFSQQQYENFRSAPSVGKHYHAVIASKAHNKKGA